MEVGYGDGTITPLFSVEFQDGDGNAVGKDAADIIYDIEELKAIAALNTDESASITFDCPKDAKQFKVNSTFKVNGKTIQTKLELSQQIYQENRCLCYSDDFEC